MSALVDVRDLRFHHSSRLAAASDAGGGWAIDGLDLGVEAGETLGIVGESGSGKSTLIRVMCGLLPARSGAVTFDARTVPDWFARDPREFRRRNQMVFQNPARSLDPRMRVGRSLTEPVKAIERRTPKFEELAGWLRDVGLGADVLAAYPHQLSGGQLQRVALARALSLRPSVLYADEPTSALDVSVQAQVLNLFMDLRTRLGLTLVMVSHDMSVISRLCDRIAVMKNGKIVESGGAVDVLRAPASEYTRSLIEAAQAISLSTP